MLFLDDCSRKVWCYLLKSRDEAQVKIQEHVKMVERQKYPLKVAFIRTDGAKELVSNSLNKFYLDNGIHPENSAPYSQAQDGLPERYMMIIGESCQAMLAQAGCEQYDWPYAACYAAYLTNTTPTKGLNNDITPNEAYDGIHRNYKVEGIFGCLCYAKVFVRKKAEAKARRCVFLGRSVIFKAFIVRDSHAFNQSKQIFYSRDVVFDPTIFPYRNVLVPRPVALPRDSSADPVVSLLPDDVSDIDVASVHDELDEKHVTEGEEDFLPSLDSVSDQAIEEQDLLEPALESADDEFANDMPELAIDSDDDELANDNA
jgi:hypothetical protein